MKHKCSPILTILILSVVFTTCGQQPQIANESTDVPSHVLWDSLLSTHVNNEGLVDYRGFIRDSVQLNDYLIELSNNSPNNNWATDDQLAYWINLYNAATIKLITNYYPIKSIKDIGASIQIPFINTPWQKEFITLNGQIIDLDKIEHGIIRKQFDEPRIHFALVCAAVSCPKLRDEAYQGSRLDEQLTDQAKTFLADKNKNNISPNHVTISKLFRWYGGDFNKKISLIQYLNKYSPTPINKEAEIDFMDYDWELNEL